MKSVKTASRIVSLNITSRPSEIIFFSLGFWFLFIFKKCLNNSLSTDFNYICSYKFSANDYIKISNYFDWIFIDNIPLLGRNKLNEIRRFIILIDILYEKKSKIYIRSDRKLSEMFDVKKIPIPFQRTVSRISEMTSKEWNN